MVNNTPKRRGRPPKATAAAAEATKAASSAAPKRGRGRPPKAKESDAEATTPRRRGRPPKAKESDTVSSDKGKAAKGKATKPAAPAASIVGGYDITCEEITTQWPHRGEDFGLDIAESGTPGVYQGSFDLGVLEGAMLLSTDEALLDEYVDTLKKREKRGWYGQAGFWYEEDEEDEDDEDEDDEPELQPAAGRKRKATTTGRRGPPSKKAKTTASLKFHLRWRGRETDGEIYFIPEAGQIKFTNKNYTKFTGEINLPFVGPNVKIVGEKATVNANVGSDWNEYSEAAYERARVRRWH